MFRSTLGIIGLFLFGINYGFAQTDSTDLDLHFSALVLETSLDSLIYPEGDFEMVELDFTVEDTLSFQSVCVELKNNTTSELLLKRIYTLTELQSEGLITGWDVNLPFGNFPNDNSYRVEVIIEDYTGALGSVIQKTLIP